MSLLNHETMNFQLIQGQFNVNEAIDIITQMIQIKIKYHENKISKINNEEDIKYREEKIKRLQKELFEVRKELLARTGSIKMDAVIHFE
jgi:hypothetical protein